MSEFIGVDSMVFLDGDYDPGVRFVIEAMSIEIEVDLILSVIMMRKSNVCIKISLQRGIFVKI